LIRLDEHNVGASRLGRGRDFLSVISIFRNKTINYVENCFVFFCFFVVVVVDGGVVGVPPFSLFSHLVVVLVSGMTVSRRLGRRRHARAFSRSLFLFHFLFSFFPPIRPSSLRPPLVHDDRCLYLFLSIFVFLVLFFFFFFFVQ
jgi:hypothetical protein